MGQKSSNMSHNELEFLERKLTDEIFRAMGCDRLKDLLYEHIAQSENLEDNKKSRIRSKTFTLQSIRSLLGSFCHGDYPLLSRTNSDNTTHQSNLVKKLIAAGASERIINNAKDLRANAARREIEILASGFLEQDAQLTNVQMRLEILTNLIVAKHENLQAPANTIWHEVFNDLTEKIAFVDPDRIYRRDPYILLGAVCGLSDECKIDWGVKIA
jgi:hypothetical protein